MFFISQLLFIISVIGLLLGTYTDLKWRIIPNYLTYSMMVIGVIIHFVFSFFSNDYLFFIYSVVSWVIAYSVGYALYRLGVWAGGDVKMFMGLSALNPINYFVIGNFIGLTGPLFESIFLPIFPFSLFVFSLFAMFPYALIISLIGIFRRPKIRKKLLKLFSFEHVSQRIFKFFQLSVVIFGIDLFFFWLKIPEAIPINVFGVSIPIPLSWPLGLILIFLITTLPVLVQRVIAAILFIILIWQFGLDGLIGIIQATLILFLIWHFILTFMKLLSLSKEVLRKEINVLDLKEGDIPTETIFLLDGKIIKLPTFDFSLLKKAIKTKNINILYEQLQPKGTVIADARSAGGLTDEQVEKIKNLAKDKLIEDRISVKISSPFAPAILIGYVLLNIIGDLLWNILF